MKRKILISNFKSVLPNERQSHQENIYIEQKCKTLPASYAYCEGEMQMLHKEMQCTCYQLVLGVVWWVAPSHHINASQLAGLPINSQWPQIMYDLFHN